MSVCESSRPRLAWASLALGVLFAPGANAAGQSPGQVLRVEGRVPQRAIVTLGESWDTSLPLDTEMARLAAGVLARYEGESVGDLLRCATGRRIPDDAAGRRIAIVHLWHQDWVPAKRVELLVLPDAAFGARVVTQGAPGTVLLLPQRFRALAAAWPAYRGSFEAPEISGKRFTVTKPYEPGAFTMDRHTMMKYLYHGKPARIADADRDLDRETFQGRLPAGYDPRRPAGLLVWCSPAPTGTVPAAFDVALDDLNMVCIGADNAGNARDIPDTFQLIFDAIATARQRFHIDPQRIYITGMSGGGEVSSILAICFPEVFRGAIPIVGLGTHSQLDHSWGRHRAPYFARPRGVQLERARTLRIALMGGPPDFNYREMAERARLLEDDGFESVRFFEYADMAHEMPTPGRFAETLRWVDEPYRARREELRSAAVRGLAEYLAGRDESRPPNAGERAALTAIIEAAPWTEPAWEALELLRGGGGQ